MSSRASRSFRNEQICDAYEKGMPVSEISRRYGLSATRTYAVLRENGYSRKGNRRRMRSERNREIFQSYMRGVPAVQLADQYGISRARVYYLLNRFDGYRNFQAQKGRK